jgi:hypothetical protein
MEGATDRKHGVRKDDATNTPTGREKLQPAGGGDDATNTPTVREKLQPAGGVGKDVGDASEALLKAKDVGDASALSGEALLKAKAAEFQWEVQWYPVGWAVDFEKGKLHKVTLFDKDYVLLCNQGMPQCQ